MRIILGQFDRSGSARVKVQVRGVNPPREYVAIIVGIVHPNWRREEDALKDQKNVLAAEGMLHPIPETAIRL